MQNIHIPSWGRCVVQLTRVIFGGTLPARLATRRAAQQHPLVSNKCQRVREMLRMNGIKAVASGLRGATSNS